MKKMRMNRKVEVIKLERRYGSTISCGTFQEGEGPSFGEIFRYFQETGNNHALWRSFTADATILQVLEGYVNKET